MHAIIGREDKIALIGANGKGKSTLLRIIAGTEPVEGKRQEGYNVIRAFFAQHQLESLDLENEILQELVQAGTDKSEMELRGVLGCFLFGGDDAFKKIKVLSGGEKSRVALAKTLISEANFLLLDEPTNHLDMLSVNILVQALDQYLGSFVIVSHDRHFVSQVANKIWYIEDLEIKEYPGTYDEFELWYSEREKRLSKEKTAENNTIPKKKVEPIQPDKKAPSTGNGELKALQNELKSLEENIAQLEKRKKQIEAELAKPEIFGNFEKLAEVNSEFEKLQQSLAKSNKEWEKLFLKLEEA